ncbi:SDR family oxidoreductase [Staphylococcus saprophyticus]|uniref:SDR family oxidoreductase n=1 Tax=Staphylococcus saprophyticus TaxID=29385 RepID=UPI00289ED8C8|nr:SDR family oxidoreductase [Staphylococcus saprophyticus]
MKTYLILGGNGIIANYYIEHYIDLNESKVIVVDLLDSNIQFNNCYYFNFDASNPDGYSELLYFLKNEEITIDNVLFSIGINYQNSFFTSKIEEFNKTLTTNLSSFFISIKKIYSYLSSKASIVALSSQNGIVGHEDRIDYGPSKAALIQITKNLTVDFANAGLKGIRFNAVSPGYVETSINKELLQLPKFKKLLKRNPYASQTSLDEVCGTISFLFSASSSAIRGQNLVVDYGYTIT